MSETETTVACFTDEEMRLLNNYIAGRVGRIPELVARLLDRLEKAEAALRKARGYVEEPGEPGTVVETTEESAARSKALLAEIDAALAAPAPDKEPHG